VAATNVCYLLLFKFLTAHRYVARFASLPI
jgi:hypothetical protein